jgi:hypothetical protein
MGLLAVVKQANQPGPPEHSIAFRTSATTAVLVSIAACQAQGELAPWIAISSIVLVAAGSVFSYRRRTRPLPFLKLVLALAVVGAFLWFFAAISGDAGNGNIASVEGPLAVLFTVIQVTHAFDVPSRRDLGFSLAGSATLMAVAAAQAIDDTFAFFVVLWAVSGLIGLLTMWGSMAGGSPLRPRTVAIAGAAVLVVGLGAVVVLPAPHANSSLVLPQSIASDLAISSPAGLFGGGPKGTEPVHAASARGRTGVGGFLGFAGPLDTAVRGSLGTQVVLRVRADRPTFWTAETFEGWNGQSWTVAPLKGPRSPSIWRIVGSGSPFTIPPSIGGSGAATPSPDYQTFYLSVAQANLVFHATDATEVWFPAKKLFVSPAGTIRSGSTMGPGSIYTVLSTVNAATPAQLSRVPASGTAPQGSLPSAILDQSLQLPHPYPRVRALAEHITAHATGTYAKVVALEDWIGAHTRYTTDIPPLSAGQDTVTEFLFGTRRGYCEQISTSLAVMLRTLGIPAREATGYVPGSYDPITDLYEVQAKDAHAWVQVWFPGYGWQSFDPTAVVPLANPTPGDIIGHDLAHLAREVPWAPLGAAAALVLAAALLVRWRRRAPATWAAAMTREIERAARRAGLGPTPDETLAALAARLDERGPPAAAGGPTVRDWAAAAERAAFGGREPDGPTRRALLSGARRFRRGARRLRAGAPNPPTGDRAPRPSPPRQPAGAGRPSAGGGG